MSRNRNKVKEQYISELAYSDSLFDKNIVFSFKYFTYGDDSGQSFEDWQKESILADLNDKLKDFSGKTKSELLNDKILEIYETYPKGSYFVRPKNLVFHCIQWARFKLTGRRRLIGFFIDDQTLKNVEMDEMKNTFFIVFLDKNHLFAPSKKS